VKRHTCEDGAMAVWEIVLLVIVVLVGVLFLGGYVANARRNAARERQLRERIAQADQALAEARATDRGWDRERLEAAVLAALEARRPGVPVQSMELVQVVDLPGTDSDSAVFHVVTGVGQDRLELIRTGDLWSAA
jgi:type II secretory pathway pseudopilin PulG